MLSPLEGDHFGGKYFLPQNTYTTLCPIIFNATQLVIQRLTYCESCKSRSLNFDSEVLIDMHVV